MQKQMMWHLLHKRQKKMQKKAICTLLYNISFKNEELLKNWKWKTLLTQLQYLTMTKCGLI